jgi:hypothetical protein
MHRWQYVSCDRVTGVRVLVYCGVEEDLFVYVPDWWPDLIPDGYCLLDTAGSPGLASTNL